LILEICSVGGDVTPPVVLTNRIQKAEFIGPGKYGAFEVFSSLFAAPAAVQLSLHETACNCKLTALTRDFCSRASRTHWGRKFVHVI
jgi:hypothetical protein